MSSGRRVLIGIGNEWAHDDGLGPVVVREVAARRGADAGVDVIELDGEPTRLLDAWTGAALAVVVDAARLDGSPLVVRDGRRLPDDEPARSSHGLGLRAAVELGDATGRLPDRLAVVAVAGADFHPGFGLSSGARANVAAAVDEIERLLGGTGCRRGDVRP